MAYPRGKPHPKRKSARNAAMLRQYRRGVPPSEIGRKFGLTRERVHQILRDEQLRILSAGSNGECSMPVPEGYTQESSA